MFEPESDQASRNNHQFTKIQETWRERAGMEVGGGIRMGKTCEPKAFSFQCMTKFTTNKKKK